jgi:hypothetical protein
MARRPSQLAPGLDASVRLPGVVKGQKRVILRLKFMPFLNIPFDPPCYRSIDLVS